jgi:hypothetical protein
MSTVLDYYMAIEFWADNHPAKAYEVGLICTAIFAVCTVLYHIFGDYAYKKEKPDLKTRSIAAPNAKRKITFARE